MTKTVGRSFAGYGGGGAALGLYGGGGGLTSKMKGLGPLLYLLKGSWDLTLALGPGGGLLCAVAVAGSIGAAVEGALFSLALSLLSFSWCILHATFALTILRQNGEYVADFWGCIGFGCMAEPKRN